MAHFIQPTDFIASAFQGLTNIFQFTNWDGEFVPFNCGQAAAATYLTYRGCLPPVEEQANTIMRQIEADHPPDNFGGWLGTSRRRVERICRAHGVKLSPIRGEQRLRESLGQGRPVIVMCGVPGPQILKRYTLPAGHWMVAYGYDDSAVHLTNWGKMSWPDFRARWNSIVPSFIGMRNIGLTAV